MHHSKARLKSIIYVLEAFKQLGLTAHLLLWEQEDGHVNECTIYTCILL